jgi:hypothetical protein
MKKPTFILGVGAQKAGTTWLYQQLNHSSIVNMGCLKEYHVWDAIYNEDMRAFISIPKKNEKPEDALRRLMQRKSGVYEQYFSGLISGNVSITGDITPSYAVLTSEQFTAIKKRLENVGFNVKIIFLMRDPVWRNWSAFRMRLRDLDEKKIDVTLIANQFKNFYTNLQFKIRTNYDFTINALRTSFSEDAIFIGFYENLFDLNSLNRLSTFIDADLHPDINKKYNSSIKKDLPSEIYKECMRYYENIYHYCYKEFPITKDLWGK